MKPVNSGGHQAYQQQLISLIKNYYPDAFVRFESNLWKMIDKFYNLDLSEVDQLMADRYSVFGPPPRLPSCMLRSMMVALYLKIPSFTLWSQELKLNPIAAILSGFMPDNTPGVGTFYDFADRLWLSKSDNLSTHVHPPKKKKVKKPAKPDDKADSIEDISVEQLINSLENNPPSAMQPYSRLFTIFNSLFLQHSAELGLINLSDLILSGDGSCYFCTDALP